MNLLKHLSGTLCIILFICMSFNAEAQFKKIKLGDISDEHKAYVDCDFSPGSGAIVLKNIGESYNQMSQGGVITHYRFHKVIKILTKDGLDEGNIKFTSSGNINTLKASTYNEENGEWVTTKFEKSNLYKEKIKGRKGVSNYKIPMPNVSVGSIIEILVEIKYLNSFFIPDWYFQDDIPVLFSSYTTSHINDFIYKKEVKSYFPIERAPIKNTHKFIGNRDFDAAEYKFFARNIPPINLDERYAPDPYSNASHVEITLSEIRSNVFKNEEVMAVNYLEYSNGLLKSKSFGGLLEKEKTGNLSRLGIDIKAEDDLIKRATIIYNTIQEKIEWNEYYSVFPVKSPFKTIKDGIGEVADINMLLVASLREAGVKAFPLVASTRENGVPGAISPGNDDFDYLLCVIRLDDNDKTNDIVLDASRKGLPFRMLPRSVLNKSGYLIDKYRYGWVPIQDNAIHEEVYVARLKIEDDVLKGTIMTKLGDYASYRYYNSDDSKETEELKESFKKSIAADWEWDEINFSEIVKEKPVVVKGEISKDFELEDLIYVEPVLFKIFNENPFKEEKRIAPVDIPYQIKYRMIFSLEIPEGYAVEEVPKSNQLNLPDDGGQFTYITEEKGNKISISITFHQKTVNFTSAQYEVLHSFYSLFHEQLENMIVLKKL